MDGSAWMALRDGANREEAWELQLLLASPEYERAAAELQGYVPARDFWGKWLHNAQCS